MTSPQQTARAVLSEIAGREVIAAVAPLLQRAGIAVMPLKGAWLQACVYGHAGIVGVRAITDVDLLVREAQFRDALIALIAGGFRARDQHTGSERSLDHDALSLPVDLHCRLFTRGAFRLSTTAMFARAHADASAFGVPLLMPTPEDVFAHLVGHFVKSRTQQDDRTRLADFAAIVERYALDPTNLARHLNATGMARAARYALHDLAQTQDGAFFSALIAALPRDPIGEQLAATARRLAQQALTSPAIGLGAAPGFLLDRSLPAGALSLALRISELVARRTAARHASRCDTLGVER